MAIRAKAVANKMLDIAWSDEAQITPMKIQKLVYLSHGWHLALHDAPLIDEQVEAWKFGPVIRTLYHAFKEFGNEPIQSKATRVKFSSPDDRLRFEVVTPTVKSAQITALLERVWNVYGKYSAIQLSKMTHNPGSPWERIASRYGGDPPKGTDIPERIIKAYFKKLAFETA